MPEESSTAPAASAPEAAPAPAVEAAPVVQSAEQAAAPEVGEKTLSTAEVIESQSQEVAQEMSELARKMDEGKDTIARLGDEKEVREYEQGAGMLAEESKEAQEDYSEQVKANVSNLEDKIEYIKKERSKEDALSPENKAKEQAKAGCPICGAEVHSKFCTKCGASREEAREAKERERRFIKNVKEALEVEKPYIEKRAKTFGISEERLKELLVEVENNMIENNKENINKYLKRRQENVPAKEANSKFGSYNFLTKETKMYPEHMDTALDFVKILNHEFTHLALDEVFLEKMNRKWLEETQGKFKSEKELQEDFKNFISQAISKLDEAGPVEEKGDGSFQNEPEVEEECEKSLEILKNDMPEQAKEGQSDEEIKKAIEDAVQESVEATAESEKDGIALQNKFFGLCTALSESAAYVSEDSIRKDEFTFPDFQKYKNITDPVVFNYFYVKLADIAEKLDLTQSKQDNSEDFDMIVNHLMSYVSDKWSKANTSEDYENALLTSAQFLKMLDEGFEADKQGFYDKLRNDIPNLEAEIASYKGGKLQNELMKKLSEEERKEYYEKLSSDVANLNDRIKSLKRERKG